MSTLRNFLLSCVLLMSVQAHAQFYDLGQDPAPVKWKVIKTGHFKIIFPAGIEAQAQHIANGFEQVYEPLSADMKIKPEKIPVILHSHSVISNAEVPWAPKRIEFFLCPGQDDYAQPWVDQLTLHEFRHVVQYNKINQGFTKVLSYIFGQQITAGVIGTFVPLWFVEGDAVYAETAFSNSGRGRLPSFTMKMRAQVQEKGIYNYNKACFGSYRTFTPNRYELGYQLVSTARKHFSDAVWERAMNKSGKLPVMVVPFNYGIKNVSGLNKVNLYKYCFQDLQCLWNNQQSQIKLTGFTPVKTPINKLYTSYNFTGFYGKDSYISVRSGMNDITRFVCIDSNGRERKLFTPGSFQNTAFSVSSGKIVWAETSYDLRWENRTYSIIKIYDIDAQRIRQLSHRSRFFAPALHRGGDKVVCVEQSVSNRSAIVVLDAENGNILSRYDADSADFLMTPRWSETGNEIIYIALNRYGKRICLIDSAGKPADLTEPGYTEIAQPVLYKELAYFVSAHSGINNIFALDINTKRTWQVTSSAFGVSDPAVSEDGKELLYSDYTAHGFRPVRCAIDTAQWRPVTDAVLKSDTLYQPLGPARTSVIDFYEYEKKTYPVKPYSRFLNLFNFHSWGPISVNADNTTIKPGVELLSQNLLSTMYLSAGYEHEWNKPRSHIYAKLSYRGWYPRINMQAAYYFFRDDTITWNVLALQCGIDVPFYLTKGKYHIFLQPEVNFNYYGLLPGKNYPAERFSGYYQAMEYSVYGYSILKTSLRDINPKWGQLLEFTYRHTPFSGAQLGQTAALQGLFFFPGIGRHHSLSIYGGYQQKYGREYIFGDIVSLPHGYESIGFKRLFVVKGAYEMPLFYPDWSIGSLFYFKRFRASAYYDYAYITDVNNAHKELTSAGLALLADFHFLRFLAPLSMGIRTTYRFDDGAILPEFIYSVNFDQLRYKSGFSRSIY